MKLTDAYSLSVTIPYYQGEQYIKNCIRSILENAYPVNRIYVIDNSPSPSAFSDLLGPLMKNPALKFIRTKPGIGFGRACNIGVYQGITCGDDFCVILNQDAILDPHCLEQLISPFSLDPEIFAVVPVSMTYDLQAFNPKTLTNYIFPVDNLVGDWLTGQLKPYYPLHFEQANGACVAFRTTQVKKVGLFDPVFWLYGEDLELFQRAQLGFDLKIALAPQARIGHLHSNFSVAGKEADRIESLSRHGRQIAQIKNPKKPFSAALPEAIVRNLRPYLRALGGGKFHQLGQYLKMDWKLLKSLPRIYRNRSSAHLHRQIEKFLEADRESP